MITSKVIALSLLLVSPLALARVQMYAKAELKNSPAYGNHRADIVFQIDAKESLEVYNHDNIRVVAELLAEEETTATICFIFYAKNEAGEWEQISAPVLVPNYTSPATLSMGSTNGDIFTIVVEAQKV
ncbi:hypothetical protein BH09DEP1_BH09DEP1_5290 [soil metagenome]